MGSQGNPPTEAESGCGSRQVNASERHAKLSTHRTGSAAIRAARHASVGRGIGVLLALVVACAELFSASSATAAKFHLPLETFGSVAHPSFTRPLSVAVDQSAPPSPTAGDVLVLDAGANEEQSLKVTAAAGQFRLTYAGLTTDASGAGELTLGSKLVKNLTGISGTLTRGESISGTGIPAGATISKLVSATEIEISANATQAGMGVALNVGGLPFNITAANLKAALEDLTGFVKGIAVSGGPGNVGGSAPYKITFQNRNAEQLTSSDGETPLSGGSPGSEATITTITEGVDAAIERFEPDGSPAPFAGLGGNSIDGQRGPGGNTGAECEIAPEPASCDETPENGILIPTSAVNGPGEVQIAVDDSGTITDGDIYLTQAANRVVYVFSGEGKYLGLLSAAGATSFGEICGAAVTEEGHVLLGQFNPHLVHTFVPAGNPVVNGDFLDDSSALAAGICNVAAGGGSGPQSTAGAIFAARNSANPVFKINAAGESPYTFGSGRLVSVDPTKGTVLVSGANNVATEYDASGETGATRESTLVAPAGSTVQGLAVDGASGDVYLTRTGSSNVEVYGPVVSTPTVKSLEPTEVTPTSATLNGSIVEEGEPLEGCVFEYDTMPYAEGQTPHGASVPCGGDVPADGKPHPVSAHVTGLEPEATYHLRIVASNAVGSEETADRAFTTARTVITESASGITAGTATLNGTVNPAGHAITECKFEYGSDTGYGSTVPCAQAPGSIEPDFQYHHVSASLEGLALNATYHFRLVVTAAGRGSLEGDDEALVTLGNPQVVEQYAENVGQSAATIVAKIDPSGLATGYHFEWGPTGAYGNRVPASIDLSIGSGIAPVEVTAELTGLDPATEYHFRAVAANSAGTTRAPDQSFGTLDTAGFPDRRVAELVSPRTSEKGPLAVVGEKVSLFAGQMLYQVSSDGRHAAFDLAPGLGDSTAGGEVLYGAARSADGWSSDQLSPPALESVRYSEFGANYSGFVSYVSPDLRCAVVASRILLTPDAPARAVEEGGANLFRRNPDGSFTLLTPLSPSNAATVEVGSQQQGFLVVGASPDCSRIYFQTKYDYEGVGVGGNGDELYEWNAASIPRLRHVGFVPGSTDEVAVPAEGGGPHGQFIGAVSVDGGRVAFTATRQRPGAVAGAAENGKQGVFVRVDGKETVDVSESETATPDSGARYQYATPDGAHVFFLANYGLAHNGSSSGTGNCASGTGPGCDLYEYDLAKSPSAHPLNDLSADRNPSDSGGAAVAGVLGASDDGSYVYFAATGQLVAGMGETESANLANSTYNIYLAQAGVVSYVGSIGAPERQNLVTEEDLARSTNPLKELLSRVSPDGRHLLFESSLPFAGYDGHGAREAYLYSSETESVRCLSCRRDGQVPLGGVPSRPLGTGESPGNALHPPATLSGDGTTAFFESPDPLAPGAVAGNQNIYEWRRGTVYLLATARALPEDQQGRTVLGQQVVFAGASEDGADAFIVTTRPLASQDTDERKDLYDLRVGGGFPAEAGPPAPCDALSEGACQGAPRLAPPALAPHTPGFSGPGNPAPSGPGKKRPRHHNKHSKHHRGKYHHKKKQGKRKASKKAQRSVRRGVDGGGK